jgi:hypothetical protein
MLLEEFKAVGSKVLLFSLSTKVLDIIEAMVEVDGHVFSRLDGSTSIPGAAAVASFLAAVLAEIYLCDVCSCQEILRCNGRGQIGSASARSSTKTPRSS